MTLFYDSFGGSGLSELFMLPDGLVVREWDS